jgi:hypothetical protein
MKSILTFTSIIESGTGLVLIIHPLLLTKFLFASTLDTPVTLTFARLAGVTILALAVACWFARNEGQHPAARGLVSAMLLYNTGVTLVLIYAALGLSLLGIGLWPIVLIHLAMSVWCISNLLKKDTMNN